MEKFEIICSRSPNRAPDFVVLVLTDYVVLVVLVLTDYRAGFAGLPSS